MIEETKPLTWRDIKEFASKLNDQELDSVVNVQHMDDESWVKVDSIEQFEEDWVSVDGEGSIPISDFNIEEHDGKELSELDHVICAKGTIIIWTI